MRNYILSIIIRMFRSGSLTEQEAVEEINKQFSKEILNYRIAISILTVYFLYTLLVQL